MSTSTGSRHAPPPGSDCQAEMLELGFKARCSEPNVVTAWEVPRLVVCYVWNTKAGRLKGWRCVKRTKHGYVDTVQKDMYPTAIAAVMAYRLAGGEL